MSRRDVAPLTRLGMARRRVELPSPVVDKACGWFAVAAMAPPAASGLDSALCGRIRHRCGRISPSWARSGGRRPPIPGGSTTSAVLFVVARGSPFLPLHACGSSSRAPWWRRQRLFVRPAAVERPLRASSRWPAAAVLRPAACDGSPARSLQRRLWQRRRGVVLDAQGGAALCGGRVRLRRQLAAGWWHQALLAAAYSG